MSTSQGSTVHHSKHSSWMHCGGGGHKGNWSLVNTVVMVMGFMFFWPIGLFLLFWILSGREVQQLPGLIRQQWSRLSGKWSGHSSGAAGGENVVFNDYQNTQYDRIREIRDEINARARRFSEFRASAQRRKDQQEFDDFMASAPDSENQ